MHTSALFSVWGGTVQWFREQTGNRLFSQSTYLPGLNLVPVHPDWVILGRLNFEPGAFKNVFNFVRVIQVECVVIMLVVHYPLSLSPPTMFSSSPKPLFKS